MVMPGGKTVRRHGHGAGTDRWWESSRRVWRSCPGCMVTAAGVHAEAAAATQATTGHALYDICVCLGVLHKAKHINYQVLGCFLNN